MVLRTPAGRSSLARYDRSSSGQRVRNSACRPAFAIASNRADRAATVRDVFGSRVDRTTAGIDRGLLRQANSYDRLALPKPPERTAAASTDAASTSSTTSQKNRRVSTGRLCITCVRKMELSTIDRNQESALITTARLHRPHPTRYHDAVIN